MSDNTTIEWAEATVNAVNGCSLASPGCTNCYAMRLAGTRMKHHPTRAGLTQDSKAGPVWTGEVRLHEPALLQPLAWKRPRRIFWNAHGDTFHDAVPDEWIDRVMAVCALTPQHTHMILTKRSVRMREYMTRLDRAAKIVPGAIRTIPQIGRDLMIATADWPLPNVWLGVSVEDQTRADERIPDLLATPAAVRFISAEPLLRPVELGCIEPRDFVAPAEWRTADMLDVVKGEGWVIDEDGQLRDTVPIPKLDWVIVGGESGPDARPMHPDWARSLRDKCAAAGVPFHFKQWGEWAPIDGPRVRGCFKRTWPAGERPKVPKAYIQANGRVVEFGQFGVPSIYHSYLMAKLGKKAAGRLLDGIEHNGVPA